MKKLDSWSPGEPNSDGMGSHNSDGTGDHNSDGDEDHNSLWLPAHAADPYVVCTMGPLDLRYVAKGD